MFDFVVAGPEHGRAMMAELLGKQRILIVEDDWVVE
jgi:hypothetical protein